MEANNAAVPESEVEVRNAVVPERREHEVVPQLRFPPGFRFVPKEVELVDVYLRRKIAGQKLPLDVVNDVSILDWQPGPLVEAHIGYGENKWFFFTVWEPSSSNKADQPSRKVRAPGGVKATWKATGSVTHIKAARPAEDDGDRTRKVVVGTKRVLIYNSTDPDEHGKWSMHEYVLNDSNAIGQYVLCSIQRKQNSDNPEKKTNKRKMRTDDMDSEKETKKKRGTVTPSTEPPEEGVQVQLPHPETALLVEPPPLKPTRKTTKVQRKRKAPVKAKGKQQPQGKSPPPPAQPVTPPNQDHLSFHQQERQQPLTADGAPLLSAVPLQGCMYPPSNPDGIMLGASAPMFGVPSSYPCDDDGDMFQFHNGRYSMTCYNPEQQSSSPSFPGSTLLAAPAHTNVVDHAPLQLWYPEEEAYDSLIGVQNQHDLFSGGNQSFCMYADPFLPGNSNATQVDSSAWKHGHQHQIQQQENNGVQDHHQHMNPLQGGGCGDLFLNLDDFVNLYGADMVGKDVFAGSLQSHEADAFARGALSCEEPDLTGTQQTQEEGYDPVTLQQDERLELPCGQSQVMHDFELCSCFCTQEEGGNNPATLRSAVSGHMCDGPCSCSLPAAAAGGP